MRAECLEVVTLTKCFVLLLLLLLSHEGTVCSPGFQAPGFPRGKGFPPHVWAPGAS